MTAGAVIVALIFLCLYVERLFASRRQRRFLATLVQSVRTMAVSGGSSQVYISDTRTPQEQDVAKVVNQALDTTVKQVNRLSEERDVLTHILQTMTTGVIYVGTSGKIEMMNQAAEQMFLQPFHEVEGREHWTAIHNYELGAALDNALLFGRRWSAELTLRESLTVNFQVIPIPLEAPDGLSSRTIHTALLLCTDVSQWRRLEQMRSDFVANVSHELKTPITAIQGFAETLLDVEKDAATEREFLHVILDESVRMHNLVTDLLTLTKLESGDTAIDFKKVSIEDLVAESLQVVEPMATTAKIQLENQVHSELPAFGQREQLKQVLLNLISNAIHYTAPGGRVTVYAETYVDRVKIHVSDTGIGIPKEHQVRVFERFYRVDRDRSRATGGTGLGLAIAKHIVQMHGGTIGVDSEPGEGSDFWFTVSRFRPTP